MASELPNLLGEKGYTVDMILQDELEQSHPSSEAMKAFFEGSLTTVIQSEVESGTGGLPTRLETEPDEIRIQVDNVDGY